jgi:hypothetical protein
MRSHSFGSSGRCRTSPPRRRRRPRSTRRRAARARRASTSTRTGDRRTTEQQLESPMPPTTAPIPMSTFRSAYVTRRTQFNPRAPHAWLTQPSASASGGIRLLEARARVSPRAAARRELRNEAQHRTSMPARLRVDIRRRPGSRRRRPGRRSACRGSAIGRGPTSSRHRVR